MEKKQASPIAGFKSETADVDGINLHYWLGGDSTGQPVLLWHGFLATAYDWHKVMPLLAEAGFSILAPDMRGYGDSDKPEGTEGYDARALLPKNFAVSFGRLISAAENL